MLTERRCPAPAETLALTALSENQLEPSEADAPNEKPGDQSIQPKLFPMTVTDRSPVDGKDKTINDDNTGELNVITDEMAPNEPAVLTFSSSDLDAPDGILRFRTESLTHTVESVEVPPNTIPCDIAEMLNLNPRIVELTEPETGSVEPDTVKGAGASNRAARVIDEIKCKLTLKANCATEPAGTLETMEESETHRLLPAAEDPQRIAGEYDAKPKRFPKSVTDELPVV